MSLNRAYTYYTFANLDGNRVSHDDEHRKKLVLCAMKTEDNSLHEVAALFFKQQERINSDNGKDVSPIIVVANQLIKAGFGLMSASRGVVADEDEICYEDVPEINMQQLMDFDALGGMTKQKARQVFNRSNMEMTKRYSSKVGQIYQLFDDITAKKNAPKWARGVTQPSKSNTLGSKIVPIVVDEFAGIDDKEVEAIGMNDDVCAVRDAFRADEADVALTLCGLDGNKREADDDGDKQKAKKKQKTTQKKVVVDVAVTKMDV
ncbi:hypothetical protein SEMRO_2006_G310550.1 [Seminavis robusta]|uniref:Uncharacterized protein n=1 Tax=Seminavis robusta TaxID=568900 RepID=A0A9N8HYJ0_9STRA|nr:hypothetical protein SEMRO_2006_G310550.1 [Seminavis robusta]|eukprot:Sro2006_g310550.1 n/a (262) ;mRNA; f:6967-7752